MTEYRQHRFERPSGATEILLVRHGESEPAREGTSFPLVDGHGDPALHPHGRAQAERLGHRLSSWPIDAVYVTNLRRTAETAAPLCDRLGIEPRVEPDLREVYLGEWEGGLMRVKAAAGDPIYMQMLEEQRWDVIPGAEPTSDFHGRITNALHRIAKRHRDELVVAVAHGGVIGALMAHATGAYPFAFAGVDNASVSHVVVIGEHIRIRSYNDTAHLHGLDDPDG